MARASAKRGGRPQSNARQRSQQAVTQQEPPRKSSSYEDQLFFTRLRRRSKWVFASLAAVFAISFIFFGVGTGVSGGSVGDFLRDLFGGGSTEAQSVADALEKVEDNPNDAQAVRSLAAAYQAAGQTRDAANSLEQYVELQPKDSDALRQLATLYQRLATQSDQQASALIGQGLGESLGTVAWSFPNSSGFLGALGENPIDEAVSSRFSARAGEASDQANRWLEKAVTTYDQLVEADPADTTALIQLGQAAANAGKDEEAIQAFERYLELDPTGPYAEPAKQQIADLKEQDTTVQTG
jgi:tetratricopeptide (TPR) repeat protein